MSSRGTTKTVVVALGTHTIDCGLKFFGFALTGSASLLSSAVHSICSITDQIALLTGSKMSSRKADDNHPFGYARERYVFAFLVSLMVFTLGGLFALWQGYSKARDVAAGHPGKLLTSSLWWVPVVILVGNLISQSFNFRSVQHTLHIKKGNKSWLRFLSSAKEPEHPVVMLETIGSLTNNSLALLGIVISRVTQNSYFDALGSALIGLSLVGLSIMMMRKTWSMLIGEGASRASLARVRACLAATDGVTSVKRFKSLHMGPDELMVVAKIEIDPDKTVDDVSTIIGRAGQAVRRVEPAINRLYLEPAKGPAS